MSSQLLSLIRTVLKFGGGVLVGKGLIDEGTMLEIVGVLMTVIGAIASFTSKDRLE